MSVLRRPGPNNAEPCLFLVGAGALKLTGYVRSLATVDWCAPHLLSIVRPTHVLPRACGMQKLVFRRSTALRQCCGDCMCPGIAEHVTDDMFLLQGRHHCGAGHKRRDQEFRVQPQQRPPFPHPRRVP